ncbi:hypothetical protein DM02DRAFT_178329 [Periconia macrospinosa]|uniref:Uncharacterized protein n=1 Tax=Periconia macrospinosa TaxID=97972 RepID=A0A2V1E1R0_9PLEO|nr:hypothetical protein DM02DRAFT_178329 [Periconia macrospinosa]
MQYPCCRHADTEIDCTCTTDIALQQTEPSFQERSGFKWWGWLWRKVVGVGTGVGRYIRLWRWKLLRMGRKSPAARSNLQRPTCCSPTIQVVTAFLFNLPVIIPSIASISQVDVACFIIHSQMQQRQRLTFPASI